MSGSNSQEPPRQRQLQREQRERLLVDAASHGPYLWTSRDVENALLWFRPHPRPRPAATATGSRDDDGGAGAGEGDRDNDDHRAEEGREFLRRLLHARGIGMRRPPPAGPGRSGRRKRKRAGGGGKSSDTGRERASGTGKGPRKTMPHGNHGGVSLESKSPLCSVIMGYYELHLPTPSSSVSTSDHYQSTLEVGGGGDGKDGAKADINHDLKNDCSVHFSASDIQSAERASSKLVEDLTSIILARRHTGEIYRAFNNVVNKENDGHAEKKRSGMLQNVMPEMGIHIDRYMTHPTTCSRRVYASSLFDRVLDLCGKAPAAPVATTDSDDNNKIGNSPTLNKYLQKLFGLAATNVQIQEVILLMLLEPVRRLQTRKIWESRHSQRTGEMSQRRTQSEDAPGDREQLSQMSRRNMQRSPGTESPDMELAPLLTSQSFWSSISPEVAERVCSHPPLPALVQFILRTSPKRKPLNNGRNAPECATSRATMGTASVTAGDGRQTMEWWTLPSPLLCVISQIHFSIACEYLRHWIEMAVVGHGQLYDCTPSATEGRPRCEEAFRRAMRRIREFRSTSGRLDSLGARILHSVEKESNDEFEMSLSGEDDVFRRSLAWKAINRLL